MTERHHSLDHVVASGTEGLSRADRVATGVVVSLSVVIAAFGFACLAVFTVTPAGGEELRRGRSYFVGESASDEATIVFSDRKARVGGVTEGGGVVWLAVWSRRIDSAWDQLGRAFGFEHDSDADGVVEIEVAEKIPTLSTWIVVDVDAPDLDVDLAEAGRFDGRRFDVVAPAPFEVRPMELSLRGVDSAAPYFESRGAEVEVLWLRPQVGIWHARIRDGGQDDLDRVGNRRLRFDATAFEAVFPAKLDPPEGPVAGDLLLGIETRSLRAFVAEVEK